MIILVVDDEPMVPRLFAQRFRKEIRSGALNFIFADSGSVALERLATDAAGAGLILSDINMPQMSGLELLDALRARGYRNPVYMVSAYDGSGFEAEALKRGASGFLAKPLSFDDLARVFAEIGVPLDP